MISEQTFFIQTLQLAPEGEQGASGLSCVADPAKRPPAPLTLVRPLKGENTNSAWRVGCAWAGSRLGWLLWLLLEKKVEISRGSKKQGRKKRRRAMD